MPEELIIDLREVESSQAFAPEQSFWEASVGHMVDLLEEHCRTLANHRDGDRKPNLVFSIFGGRGSGKSSLLRILGKRLKPAPAKGSHEGLSIYQLPCLDPTCLSKYDNFLHAFIAALLEELERETDHHRKALHELKCRSALQEMAEHLWVVNGGPPREKERVAAGLERLDRHRSGPLLKKKVEVFLDRVAEDFAGLQEGREGEAGKRILLLPVDDPDMAFNQFTESLEIYRRYLRHPYLVPIFAFSRDLAQDLLTVHFGTALGLSKKKRSAPSGGWTVAERLTHNFIDKLLPIRSRIVLDLPEARLLKARYRQEYSRSSGSGVVKRDGKVSQLLVDCARRLFGESPEEVHLHRRILPETLRRQMHLLAGFSRLLPPEEALEPGPSGDGRTLRALADVLLAVHGYRLAELGIEVERFQSQPSLLRGGLLLVSVLRSSHSRNGFPWSQSRTESLLLSLLALRMFEPEELEDLVTGNGEPGTGQAASYWLCWALHLLLGFYIPLAALRPWGQRPRDGRRERLPTVPPDYRREHMPADSEASEDDLWESALAWDLRATPRSLFEVLGLREAESMPGVLFLHPGGRLAHIDPMDGAEVCPGDYAYFLGDWERSGYSILPWLKGCRDLRERQLRSPEPLGGFSMLIQEGGKSLELFLRIWCVLGSRPRPWVGLSLWRGLGLLARVLHSSRGQTYSEGRDTLSRDLERVIREHLQDGEVHAGIPDVTDGGAASWVVSGAPMHLAASQTAAADSLASEVTTLAKNLADWAARNPASGVVQQQSVIRRLHGFGLEGELFERLREAIARRPMPSRGAGTALKVWLTTFLSYWLLEEKGDDPGDKIAVRLLDCPLFPAFELAEDLPDLAPRIRQTEAGRTVEKRPTVGIWSLLGSNQALKPLDLKDDLELLNALFPADYESFFGPFRQDLAQAERREDRL